MLKPLGSCLKTAPPPAEAPDAKEPHRSAPGTCPRPRADRNAAWSLFRFALLQVSLRTPCIPSGCVPEIWAWHPHSRLPTWPALLLSSKFTDKWVQTQHPEAWPPFSAASLAPPAFLVSWKQMFMNTSGNGMFETL